MAGWLGVVVGLRGYERVAGSYGKGTESCGRGTEIWEKGGEELWYSVRRLYGGREQVIG